MYLHSPIYIFRFIFNMSYSIIKTDLESRANAHMSSFCSDVVINSHPDKNFHFFIS